MKTIFSFKTILAAIAIIMSVSFVSARGFDGNLIHNVEEVNGLMVGQTIYKKDGNTLTNYQKQSYKYDDQQRMIESESMKWDAGKKQWANDLRVTYTYSGKTVTTNYYKWNAKKKVFVLAPDMTVTMDAM